MLCGYLQQSAHRFYLIIFQKRLAIAILTAQTTAQRSEIMKNPILYIIAGPNGAGKTTASMNILPAILDCKVFVNADEISKGLNPLDPESMAIEAGRIML